MVTKYHYGHYWGGWDSCSGACHPRLVQVPRGEAAAAEGPAPSLHSSPAAGSGGGGAAAVSLAAAAATAGCVRPDAVRAVMGWLVASPPQQPCLVGACPAYPGPAVRTVERATAAPARFRHVPAGLRGWGPRR